MAGEVKKLVIVPTQCFDVPSGRIGNRFVGIINVEIERIWDCQYNAERVIIFRTLPLQRVNGVYRARNIRDQIDSQLELWKNGPTKSCYRIPTGGGTIFRE